MSSSYFKSALVGVFIATTLIQLAACQTADNTKGTKGVAVQAKDPLAKATPEKPTQTDRTLGTNIVGGSDVGGSLGTTTSSGTLAGSELLTGSGGTLGVDTSAVSTGTLAVAAPASADSTTSKTPAEKEANWLKLHMEVLNQADQFFREGWKKASGNEQAKVTSVFGQTLNIMQETISDKGQRKEQAAGRNCTGAESDLKNVVVIPQKGKNDLPLSLEIQVQDCNNKQLNWVANSKLTGPFQLEMRFNPTRLAEGAGERMVALAKKDQKQDIYCVIQFQATGRIKMMSCQRLGQTLAKDKHLAFDIFTYDVNSPNILTMKTTVYGANYTTKDPNSCGQNINVPKEDGKKVQVLIEGTCKLPDDKTKAKGSTVDPKGPLFEPTAINAATVSTKVDAKVDAKVEAKEKATLTEPTDATKKTPKVEAPASNAQDDADVETQAATVTE